MSHCNPQGMCCGYGKDAMKTTGYDCVIIPGASKEADKADIKVLKDKPRSAQLTLHMHFSVLGVRVLR